MKTDTANNERDLMDHAALTALKSVLANTALLTSVQQSSREQKIHSSIGVAKFCYEIGEAFVLQSRRALPKTEEPKS